MSDIAMCVNDDCPSAKYCFRHEAKPNTNWQSYMDFTPPFGEDSCKDFIEIVKQEPKK